MDTRGLKLFNVLPMQGTSERKSTFDNCTYVRDNQVTWINKKQNMVSCSSAEVVYKAKTRLHMMLWLTTLWKFEFLEDGLVIVL